MKEAEKEIFNFEHPFAEKGDYKRKLKMRFTRTSSLQQINELSAALS